MLFVLIDLIFMLTFPVWKEEISPEGGFKCDPSSSNYPIGLPDFLVRRYCWQQYYWISLRRTYNGISNYSFAYLQAITSFSHAVCLLNQLPNVAFFLLNFELSRNQCVFVATPYILCANIQCVMMLFILIDSILMISFPLWYRNLGTFKYVLAMFLPALASGLFFATAAFLMVDSTRVPVCSAKRHTLEREVAEITRRLRVILFIYIISWFTGSFGANLLPFFFEGKAMQYAASHLVVFVDICYSQSFYVIIWKSSDYRKAFYSLYPRVFGPKTFENKIVTINVAESSINAS
ncbi:unnamed protein product [Caenorhabditis auriculariae]|uniref:G-protein coupled receptors family 1 profile domain-containing protein n=1 Tax=Caenorhabditis auriculariae TaxID=2777116 RepID=A0A8S1H3E8_9PELO|nr:unnamed protein product [Caenorhabditis auriculariae]